MIKQLETIARQCNNIHHKKKRYFMKKRFNFLPHDTLIIDYNICLNDFKETSQDSSMLFEDDETEENKKLIEKEIYSMSFDEYLNYLKLIGDICCFGPKAHMKILLKPYYLLNRILSTTLFRPHIDQWLNYENNIILRFSGYYPSQDLFDIDRKRLLMRGEFTWNMLCILVHEQNNHFNIFDYCHLLEQLHLGYLNQSNLNCKII